jgi:hypothetical protein
MVDCFKGVSLSLFAAFRLRSPLTGKFCRQLIGSIGHGLQLFNAKIAFKKDVCPVVVKIALAPDF